MRPDVYETDPRTIWFINQIETNTETISEHRNNHEQLEHPNQGVDQKCCILPMQEQAIR